MEMFQKRANSADIYSPEKTNEEEVKQQNETIATFNKIGETALNYGEHSLDFPTSISLEDPLNTVRAE